MSIVFILQDQVELKELKSKISSLNLIKSRLVHMYMYVYKCTLDEE